MSATVNITIEGQGDDTLQLVPVGMVPFILIQVDDVSDANLDVSIQVGGGTPADAPSEIAEFLSMLADFIERANVTVRDDEDDE